jgi:hypothetical protein
MQFDNHSENQNFVIIVSSFEASNFLKNKTQIVMPYIFLFSKLLVDYLTMKGKRGSVVVKALCYKPEGRGFETR